MNETLVRYGREYMILQTFLFVAGLTILLYGADLLVKNASLLARSLSIRPIVIGLTLVAFGTSAPEFGVSFVAALTGAKSIAIGNIIGSNIANIALILGLTALIRPIEIEKVTLRREVPWVVGTAVLLLLLSLNHKIGLFDGIVLLAVFILFIVFYFRLRTDTEIQLGDVSSGKGDKLKRALFTILGLVLLFGGGSLLVRSAVNISQALQVSELVIGLTIVSIGTSLPELATTVVAALRGESAIGVGNIIGSNVFNTCWVIGCVALVTTISVETISLRLDMPIMIFMSVLLIPFFGTGLRISRVEGLILLLLYGLFILNRFMHFIGEAF